MRFLPSAPVAVASGAQTLRLPAVKVDLFMPPGQGIAPSGLVILNALWNPTPPTVRWPADANARWSVRGFRLLPTQRAISMEPMACCLTQRRTIHMQALTLTVVYIVTLISTQFAGFLISRLVGRR